jgi:ATP-binding cassette subfamily B multidrug efflux pump
LLASLKSLNKYFIKYKWRLSLGIIFVSVSNIFAVLPPSIVRNIIDEVAQTIASLSNQSDPIRNTFLREEVLKSVMLGGIYLIAFAILRGVFMFFMRQTIIVMSRHIEYDQKKEIYDKYQQLSTAFFKNNKVGDLMSRISEDVSRVRMYTGPAIMYGINLVVLTVMCVVNMIRVSPSLSLYVLLPLPLLALSIFYVNKIVNRKSEKIQADLSNVTSLAQESYAGIRVIKSFGYENNQFNTFKEASETYKSSNINLALTEAIYGPSMNLFTGVSVLVAVLVGGYQAINGQITPGNIAEFVIYITMLTFPISAIGLTANMIQRAAVSQRRINEFLDAHVDITSKTNAIEQSLHGDVVFENVSFTYPHTGIEAIKNLSLKINKGEKVAIMGKTGSGKSTLIHLLLRMYDVSSGKITIDGIDVRDWNVAYLRGQMSYVPQEVFLFSDTVSNNISLGSAFNLDKIVVAAKAAAIHDEITKLENGYNTITGERGVMLSGGQKQRVSIARALYRTPHLLILDDSLSAVDSKTEKNIQQNIVQQMHNKTTIVISHRIFKDWNFDKIIIMEEGRIAEMGTHEELLAKNGYYTKLYKYQTEDNGA